MGVACPLIDGEGGRVRRLGRRYDAGGVAAVANPASQLITLSHSRPKNSATLLSTNTNPPGNFTLAGCYDIHIEARLTSQT